MNKNKSLKRLILFDSFFLFKIPTYECESIEIMIIFAAFLFDGNSSVNPIQVTDEYRNPRWMSNLTVHIVKSKMNMKRERKRTSQKRIESSNEKSKPSLFFRITLSISMHKSVLFFVQKYLFWQWKRTNQSEGHIESNIQVEEFTMQSTALWQWIH